MPFLFNVIVLELPGNRKFCVTVLFSNTSQLVSNGKLINKNVLRICVYDKQSRQSILLQGPLACVDHSISALTLFDKTSRPYESITL